MTALFFPMNKILEVGDHVYYRDGDFRKVRTGKIRSLNKSWCASRLMNVDITKDEEVKDDYHKIARSIPVKNILGTVRELEE